jgi:hypothetical protein
MDHTNCLQVVIESIQFKANLERYETTCRKVEGEYLVLNLVPDCTCSARRVPCGIPGSLKVIKAERRKDGVNETDHIQILQPKHKSHDEHATTMNMQEKQTHTGSSYVVPRCSRQKT